jgi:hypothetical protein
VQQVTSQLVGATADHTAPALEQVVHRPILTSPRAISASQAALIMVASEYAAADSHESAMINVVELTLHRAQGARLLGGETRRPSYLESCCPPSSPTGGCCTSPVPATS